MKKIVITARSVYGNVLYYVQGDASKHVNQLTKKITVDKQDISALRALGFEVEVKELP